MTDVVGLMKEHKDIVLHISPNKRFKVSVSTLEDKIKRDIKDIKNVVELYKGRMEHESTPFIGGLPGNPKFNSSGGNTAVIEIADIFNRIDKERVAKDDELYPWKTSYDTPRKIKLLSKWAKDNIIPEIKYNVDKNSIIAEYHYEYSFLQIPQTELFTINQLALVGVLNRYPELFKRAFSKMGLDDKTFIYHTAYHNLCSEGKNKYYSKCDGYKKEYVDDNDIIDTVLEKLEKTTKLKLEKR